MTHLDEGTIHAWIDGALDTAHASDAEAHVASCTACERAVAEARGLLAASSRILASLDGVPAGLSPRAMPLPRKPRRVGAWVTGIAAMLLGAVVLRTSFQRNTGQGGMLPAAPIPAVSSLPDTSGAGEAAVRQLASAPVEAPVPAPAATQPRVASRRAPSAPAMAGARTDVATAEAAEVRTGVAKAAAGAVAALESRAEPTDVGAFVGCYRLEPVATVAERTALAADTALAHGAPAQSFAERRQKRVAVTTGAAAAATVPAPSVARAPSVESMATPRIVRLESEQQAPGHIVRDAMSARAIGWWTQTGPDSARVDLRESGGTVRLLTPGARISCPPRP